MSDLSIAHRIFDSREPKSRFHSEADRQDHIDKLTSEIEKQILADLMRFDSEAIEIAGDLFGCMEPEKGAVILRLVMSGDPSAHHMAWQMILLERDKTIKNTAEQRAIKQVEAGEV